MQQEGTISERQQTLNRHLICQSLDIGFSSLQNYEKCISVAYKLLGVSYFVITSGKG
jgi:hypothetical protein